MRKLLIIVMIVFLMTGCRTPRQLPQSDRVITITNTIHDTVVKTKPDSAMIKAFLRCDSLGNVYVCNIESLQTSNKVKPTIEIRDNTITLKCKVDSQAVYIRWKETHVSDVTQKTLPPVYIEKALSWWQTTEIWAGRIFLILLAIALAAGIVILILKLKGII